MKLSRTLFLFFLAAFIFAVPVAAIDDNSPLYQGVAVISSPEPFATVRGNVSITGTAVHPNFQRYSLDFAPEPSENWVFFTENTNQVNNGLLGSWDTTGLPDGTYSLRLRVVRQDGNFDETIQRGIVVGNSAPTPTPTQIVLPTVPVPAGPTATPTIVASPTPVTVEQPEIPTPTPRPSPSPTPEQDGEAVDNVDDAGGLFGSTFNMEALQGAFTRGLTITAAIFLAVGAFFGVKRLLTWLWYLIAP